MIDLDNHSGIIEKFINDSIERFRIDNDKEPISIGIYCCPWAGWLTTNFNINKVPEDTYYNCPDFEFVEFDVLELEGWQEEYESGSPTYKIGMQVINHDSGDEKLNGLVFKYLEPLVVRLKRSKGQELFLQMLDSNFKKAF